MLKHWETIADNLKNVVGSLRWVSRRVSGMNDRIANAHYDGKRFVVHADKKLTAFLELDRRPVLWRNVLTA